jgi:hypothetical protein
MVTIYIEGVCAMEINIVIKSKGEESIEIDTKQADISVERDPYQHNQVFGEGCSSKWTENMRTNIAFLKSQQCFANELLRANGCLFLNDVYKMLGFPLTRCGQIAGWVFNEKYHDAVCFGIDFTAVLTDETVKPLYLEFNVRENILDFLS